MLQIPRWSVGFFRLQLIVGTLSVGTCAAIDIFYFPRSLVFGDEQRFLDSATGLLTTGRFSVYGDVAWEMPGTALFFAPFTIAGIPTAIMAIRLTQALLLVLQAALVANLAGRLFKDRDAAAVAFIVAAFYPFFIFYQALALSEMLFNTLLVGAFVALYRWRERGARLDLLLVLTCTLFGCAVYTKATLTLLPPLIMAVAAIGKTDLRQTLKVFVVSGALYAALLTPWWVRNYAVLGAFVPFTTSSSLNLYLGNNPRNLAGGADWLTDVDPLEVKQLHAIPGEIERRNAFTTKAVAYIVSDPHGFAKRAVAKFLRYWNIVPNAAEYRGLFYSIISAATFGPILLLAGLCVAVRRKDVIQFLPILLLIAYFTAVHMVTIASVRYRLPLEPFLIALAACPIVHALRRIGFAQPLTTEPSAGA